MPNRDMKQSMDMREMTAEAVRHGVRTPQALGEYFVDNGWEYSLPTRPTLEKLLKECKVEYVKGYWMLVK